MDGNEISVHASILMDNYTRAMFGFVSTNHFSGNLLSCRIQKVKEKFLPQTNSDEKKAFTSRSQVFFH